HPFGGNPEAARGYGEPHGQSGVHSGAFSGYDHGGEARSYSSRGQSSFGGGAGSTAAAVVLATLAAAGVVELNPRTNAMRNDGNDDQIQPTHPTNSRSMSRSRVRDVSAGLKSWRW